MSDVHTTTTISKVANAALAATTKKQGKQKRDFTSWLILAALTLDDEELRAMVARGRTVEIAIEYGAEFDENGNFVIDKDNPMNGVL